MLSECGCKREIHRMPVHQSNIEEKAARCNVYQSNVAATGATLGRWFVVRHPSVLPQRPWIEHRGRRWWGNVRQGVTSRRFHAWRNPRCQFRDSNCEAIPAPVACATERRPIRRQGFLHRAMCGNVDTCQWLLKTSGQQTKCHCVAPLTTILQQCTADANKQSSNKRGTCEREWETVMIITVKWLSGYSIWGRHHAVGYTGYTRVDEPRVSMTLW